MSNSDLRQFLTADDKPSLRRRLSFAVIVLISQLLLVAVSLAWLVHQVIIAKNGSVYFVENNPFILYGEIIATILITIFAICVLVFQMQRLGERRRDDRRQ